MTESSVEKSVQTCEREDFKMEQQKKQTGFPSIDRPWLKYYSEEAINAPLPEGTIYECLWENNKNYPDDVAMLYFGRKITYRELFENIEKVASAFLSLGVSKGDIITIQSLLLPQTVYVVYALNKLGAVANLIYATLNAEEIETNLHETNTKIFITMDSIYDKLNIHEDITEKVIILSIDEEMSLPAKMAYRAKTSKIFKKRHGVLSWRLFTSQHTDQKVSVSVSNSDPVVMVYTGGTTGRSKAVILSSLNLNVSALQYLHLGFFKRSKGFLCVLPPFIAFGVVVSMHGPLCHGLTAVIGIDPSDIGSVVRQYHPSYISCGNVQAEIMMRNLDIDLSFLEWFSVGGEVLSASLENDLNQWLSKHNSNLHVAQGYAMTEISAAGACSAYFTDRIVYKKGTVGIPLVYTCVKIADPETNEELSYDEQGEICINSPCVMAGYYRDEKETAAVLKKHVDGKMWVHTGDIGKIDQDGFITITGRMKRIILVFENNVVHKVFPKILEDKFSDVDGIKAISIVGKHHETRTNELVAFVSLQNEAEQETVITAIRQFANSSLEDFESPSKYVVIDKMPLTSVGKVDYNALEKMAESIGDQYVYDRKV